MPPWRVAVIGAGRMGQSYLQAFQVYPDCELVALVDNNAERGSAACERFGCPAHFRTVEEMLATSRPEIVSVVTPGAYFKEVVLACAGCPTVRAVQVEKPMGGPVADADAMVEACAAAGIVFAGGNMQAAFPELQEMAGRLRSGEFGRIVGADVQRWAGEYLGGGCQHIAVLRALTGQDIAEVIAWSRPGQGIELPGYGCGNVLLAPFYTKIRGSPRQARDKHRKSWGKGMFLQRGRCHRRQRRGPQPRACGGWLGLCVYPRSADAR
jgi:predicted dehydrogenase